MACYTSLTVPLRRVQPLLLTVLVAIFGIGLSAHQLLHLVERAPAAGITRDVASHTGTVAHGCQICLLMTGLTPFIPGATAVGSQPALIGVVRMPSALAPLAPVSLPFDGRGPPLRRPA